MPLSSVERVFVREGGRQERYASERVGTVVEVANVAALGKLVALQFLLWVQRHPTGVISLPTGESLFVGDRSGRRPNHSFIHSIDRCMDACHSIDLWSASISDGMRRSID